MALTINLSFGRFGFLATSILVGLFLIVIDPNLHSEPKLESGGVSDMLAVSSKDR